MADLTGPYHCWYFTLTTAPQHKATFLPSAWVGRTAETHLLPPGNALRATHEQLHQNFLSTGTSIIRVTAVDADDPTVAGHATVMYQILKGSEHFTIDNSGLYD